MPRVCSFLLPSSIPWYGCITDCLTIHLVKDIWVVSTFWLLWIKLLWAFVYRFSCEHKFFISLNKWPGITIAKLSGMKNCQTFPEWLYHFTFPPAMCEWKRTSLPELGGVTIFYMSHSIRCVVIYHCGLNVHFPNGSWCKTSFHVLIFICVSSSVKCVFMFFACFCNWIFCIITVELWEILIYATY